MKFRPVSRGLILLLLPILSFSVISTSTSVKADSQLFAAFTYNPCVMCAAPGDVVFFNANTSLALRGTIISYTWNFGDGSLPFKANSSIATHDFLTALPGDWRVSLTVQDSNGRTDTISQLVLFNVAPSFTIQPTHPGTGRTVAFDASSTRVYQNTTGHAPGFLWNFGDGTNGTGIIATHNYQTPGIYRILLTVTTSQGNPTISKNLIVGPTVNTGQQVQMFFDKINITLSASLTPNNTTHTITGTISIVATNTTSGTIIFARILNITINIRPDNNPQRLLVAITSTSPVITANCTVDPVTANLNCFASRDPDVRGCGTVDIIDLGIMIYDFGASRGSSRYSPAVDLDGNGTIGIIDLGILTADYSTTIY